MAGRVWCVYDTSLCDGEKGKHSTVQHPTAQHSAAQRNVLKIDTTQQNAARAAKSEAVKMRTDTRPLLSESSRPPQITPQKSSKIAAPAKRGVSVFNK